MENKLLLWYVRKITNEKSHDDDGIRPDNAKSQQ